MLCYASPEQLHSLQYQLDGKMSQLWLSMGICLTCSLLITDVLTGVLAFLSANKASLSCAPDSIPPTLTEVWEDYKSVLRCQQV